MIHEGNDPNPKKYLQLRALAVTMSALGWTTVACTPSAAASGISLAAETGVPRMNAQQPEEFQRVVRSRYC